MSSNQPCEQDPIMKAILAEYRRKARAEVTKEQKSVIRELKQTKAELAKERKRSNSLYQELKKYDKSKETFKRVASTLRKEYAKLVRLKDKPVRALLSDNRSYDEVLKSERAVRQLMRSQ